MVSSGLSLISQTKPTPSVILAKPNGISLNSGTTASGITLAGGIITTSNGITLAGGMTPGSVGLTLTQVPRPNLSVSGVVTLTQTLPTAVNATAPITSSPVLRPTLLGVGSPSQNTIIVQRSPQTQTSILQTEQTKVMILKKTSIQGVSQWDPYNSEIGRRYLRNI